MRVRSILFFLIIAISAAGLLVSESGCAVVVPPSGGPRDSLPPEIVEVSPPNETVNFDQKEIVINFNEYVDLEDVYKNLIISPLPKIMPEVTRKLKTVTIKLKDSLTENTTYVYNFAKVIKDLNEGNRAKDLLYVVSTGTYFDSLELSGNVKMARTGKADSTLTVMLYNNMDDSAIVKEKPRYITRVDTTGTFFFRYLAPGTYRIYAMKDETGSYIYNSDQIFAFADSPVVVTTKPPPPVRLWAYAPDKKPEESTGTEVKPDRKEKRLKFTTNLEAERQDILQAFTMTFESPIKKFDSTKVYFTSDSTYKPVTGHRISLDSTRRIMTINMRWPESTLYNLVLEKDFATDSLNRQLFKKDTVAFTTKSKEDYGQVSITFLNLDMSINPVLLISESDKVKDAFPITGETFKLQYYNPGEYTLEILHDANKNGKWDPGEFFVEHRQPEMVTQLSRKLTIKANWESEFEIDMKKQF